MADVDFRRAGWRKSVNSGETGCVEVALETALIGVRDSKDRDTSPILAFAPSAWTSFLDGVRGDDFTPDGKPS